MSKYILITVPNNYLVKNIIKRIELEFGNDPHIEVQEIDKLDSDDLPSVEDES